MYYDRVFYTLNRFNVKYLVAGGMAVNLHGLPRMTNDLDLIVDKSKENIVRLGKALKYLHYRPSAPVTLESFMDVANWQKWIDGKGMIAFNFSSDKRPFEEIDILIGSPIPYSEASKNKLRIKAGRLLLSVVSIDTLIRMKQRSGRKQDMSDIQGLRKIKKLTGRKRA